MSLRVVRVGVVVSGHNLASDCDRTPVVHIVRKIIEMEEPIHEVATHPELVKGG